MKRLSIYVCVYNLKERIVNGINSELNIAKGMDSEIQRAD